MKRDWPRGNRIVLSGVNISYSIGTKLAACLFVRLKVGSSKTLPWKFKASEASSASLSPTKHHCWQGKGEVFFWHLHQEKVYLPRHFLRNFSHRPIVLKLWLFNFESKIIVQNQTIVSGIWTIIILQPISWFIPILTLLTFKVRQLLIKIKHKDVDCSE